MDDASHDRKKRSRHDNAADMKEVVISRSRPFIPTHVQTDTVLKTMLKTKVCYSRVSSCLYLRGSVEVALSVYRLPRTQTFHAWVTSFVVSLQPLDICVAAADVCRSTHQKPHTAG